VPTSAAGSTLLDGIYAHERCTTWELVYVQDITLDARELYKGGCAAKLRSTETRGDENKITIRNRMEEDKTGEK
jgi:hypothetical protein